MSARDPIPAPPASLSIPQSRPWLLPAAICLALAVGIVLTFTTGRPPAAALPELVRTNLVRTDGRWRQIGHTNPFTGVLLEYYPEGAIQSRSLVANGWLEGLSEGWYTNRQLQIREYYHTNTSSGPRTKWYPNGRKLSEATIVAGQMEGLFRRWYEDGQLAEEISMHDGKIEGTGRSYYASGFLKTQLTMHNGQVAKADSWPDGVRRADRR